MNIKGYFVKIIFKFFNPHKIIINDKVLLIASKNYLFPEIIPDKYFKKFRSLESQFKTQLAYYSFFTSAGRFSPENAYNQWAIDNKKLVENFDNYKKDLILSYDTFEPFIKESNKDLIDKVWNIIYKDGGRPSENFIIETNKKIVDLLPTKEDLYNSTNFKILLFQTADLTPKTLESDKILIHQIKTELINVVSNAFDKVINFYCMNKQIRPNMLESFKKEINRINLLFFCGDIKDVVKQIFSMLYNEEHKSNPSSFIDSLGVIKKDLIKRIENYS